MKYLYSPWRDSYFKQKRDGCIFCNILNDKNNDKNNYILFRDIYCYGIMNLFPYNPGHFMIIPNQHINNIENLDQEIWLQMSLHVRNGVKMLKEALDVNGVNIGMNLGDEAGAGISEHIHIHLVPRWTKDTNFITTISKTRVISSDIEIFYNKIKKLVPKYFSI